MAAVALRAPDRGAPEAPAVDDAMSDALSDRELIRRIAQQDRDAFHDLYDRFGAPVLSYVRMLAREQEVAEDVVQEVFLSVWRKAPSFRPDRGDVAGWIYTIARNKLVDLWRRRSTRGDKEETSLDLTRFEADAGQAEANVTSIAVRKALSSLKRDQRVALELAYFGGLTYEETADRLGLPLGTLKSRIRAGLGVLRGMLSDPGNADGGSPLEAPSS